MQQPFMEQLTAKMRREKYHLVGAHSAVKKCRWLHQSLVHSRVCYKQKFYGIQSHRCLQMTPVAYQCQLRCLHCWRIQPEDLGFNPTTDEITIPYTDSPDLIVDGSIKAQRQILSGYKKHKLVDPKRYQEALNPSHAAISLTGEPTLYPHLSELIEEFHSRGMTTFLVTNGVLPQALSKLSQEPTQLYVSLHAPDEETFTKACKPKSPTAWRNVIQSLELLSSFNCPTVLRLTLTQGLNMDKAEGYAKLIDKADSTYVEAKSYFYVGFSRKRLKFENMPTHREVKAFAEELSSLTGYKIIDEQTSSRVVLLSRLKKPIKL